MGSGINAEQLFGYTANQVMGKNVKVLVPAKFRKKHDQYIKRYLKTRQRSLMGKPRVVEAVHKDGMLIPVLICLGEFLESGQIKFMASFYSENDAEYQAHIHKHPLSNSASHSQTTFSDLEYDFSDVDNTDSRNSIDGANSATGEVQSTVAEFHSFGLRNKLASRHTTPA